MFEKPASSFISCLKKLVDHPQEYLADVCCKLPHNDFWLHKPIISSRCPLALRQHAFPQLDTANAPSTFFLDMDADLFRLLIDYWYTATVPTELPAKVQLELDQWQQQLGVTLLPFAAASPPLPTPQHTVLDPNVRQLQQDLNRLLDDQQACDIELVVPNDRASVDVAITTTFPAHRCLLACQSTYFYAMFCSGFCESHTPVLHLTDPFFTPEVMQLLLAYLYTDQMTVPPLPNWTVPLSFSTTSKLYRSTLRKHTVRTLLLAFFAADYLGESHATMGAMVLSTLASECHHFKCTCHECALLLPAMLAFADTRRHDQGALRATLLHLYTDPVPAINHLWSQKPFALLVHAFLPSGASLLKTLDCSATITNTDHEPRSTLIHEIAEAAHQNVTKHNAIHVLHALHLSLSQLRSADHIPTWSLPTLDLLHPLLHSTVSMVSNHFDFYCVEYPILVSCVDGVGCGFSIDFLDFLLRHVLDEGIQDANAGIIYQGVVKDLIGRQETVKNLALDDVLLSARSKCAEYLARRWLSVKSVGGFRNIEKSVLRSLSDDIGVPYRTLSKPFDSDLLSLFTFRPKRARKSRPSPGQPYTSSKRRETLGLRRTLSSQTTSITNVVTRPRSQSASSALFHSSIVSPRSDPSKGYVNCNTINAMSTQPLIHLLSMETEARLQSSAASISSSVASKWDDILFLDALLPVEPLVPVDTPHKPTAPRVKSPSVAPTTACSSGNKLTFQLPTDAPTRVKSPAIAGLQPPEAEKKKKKRTLSPMKWTFGHHPSSSNANTTAPTQPPPLSSSLSMPTMASHTQAMVTPVIGARVQLRRRPLPTFGTIQFVGPVTFANGTWIGLELESRLGRNNGSVLGVQYFHTDPHRGIFVRPDDFTIISMPPTATAG
ncbi:hypothetical protein DM01DRAFT_1384897 [Hesseltinella vesiculosa]|uniref:CAP-Gly domain-containing protein n=1 Tax=Hesseltinella vesiculosa TaxID=101127 RepID=A0A1X2GBV9_9FUNG|nr:hypothetical protein DM01DRAFT_1384897 [Hesseltinella vesiculosa]